MSYARFGCEDSDVYLFWNTDQQWDCCGCLLQERGSFQTESLEHFMFHLSEHLEAGHTVPQSAFDFIREDVKAGMS